MPSMRLFKYTLAALVISCAIVTLADAKVSALTPPSSETTRAPFHHRRRLPREVAGEDVLSKRAASPNAYVSSAMVASSIVNNYATTTWSSENQGDCATGEQGWTDSNGNYKCCAGSIINNRCYVDTADGEDGEAINYDSNWSSIIASYDKANTIFGGVVTTTGTTSTQGENTATITHYTAIETGATTDAEAIATASSSQLSLSLQPTSGSGDAGVGSTGGKTSGAAATAAMRFTASAVTVMMIVGAVIVMA